MRSAYSEGYLRKSVVGDPLFARVNTKDNTPAVLHTRIVPGENVSILVSPKGFGSENMVGGEDARIVAEGVRASCAL